MPKQKTHAAKSVYDSLDTLLVWANVLHHLSLCPVKLHPELALLFLRNDGTNRD